MILETFDENGGSGLCIVKQFSLIRIVKIVQYLEYLYDLRSRSYDRSILQAKQKC